MSWILYRKARKSVPFPKGVIKGKKNVITADSEQRRELEKVLGPDELYGGGVLQAKLEIFPKYESQDCAHVTGKLFVLCDGDFDEDGRSPKWIEFDANDALEFWYTSPEEDEDSYGWNTYGWVRLNFSTKIINVFRYEICDCL